MKREINDDYLYLVLTPMEYSHINTTLDDLMRDAFKNNDNITYGDLEYVRYAIMAAYSSFIDMKDVNKEGGDEDEDEQ